MEKKETRRISLGGLRSDDFKKTIDGKDVDLFILRNDNGLEMTICNYGAKIVSLHVPNREGKMVDVVLGHSSIDEYLVSKEPYFGGVCGRTCNRIANGKFTLDDKEYTLAVNNGPNNLHGGIKGFNAVVWDVKQVDDSSIELHYLSKDGEEGFPGNLSTTIRYKLYNDNGLEIIYKATTDKATIINLTNHSYFNLSGAGDPSIDDHILLINADTYLPTDETSIPYGKAAMVGRTPMDFMTPREIGERIDEKFEALIFGKGYDHCFRLNKEGKELSFCAQVTSPKTDIMMRVFTTEPGVQLYTGNWMDGSFAGKDGKTYPMRSALCLETQHFPDSINKSIYPSVVLRPEDTFESKTAYLFSIDKY
ncbi:aldose 1-epimerase [Bacteroidales bacterium]|nr:aldose 1-epimerase [Bacteroidales bacterium]